MMTQLIFTTLDSIHVSKASGLTETSLWFYVAIIELLIIIMLYYKLKRSKTNISFEETIFSQSKKADINMDHLMENIHGAAALYKELSRKCHPDRFVNTELFAVAEILFQEISKNKRNYKELCLLKERAIIELNVNF